jgi:hypothetical protein
VYPTAGRKALDGKIRDFVHAVRGFQDTEKFNTFGKFMGYDIETSHSVRHYYFFCELLDCVKRLTVRPGSAVAQLQRLLAAQGENMCSRNGGVLTR